VTSADDYRPAPDAAEAVGRLVRAGWLVIVVSNQRGVARGLVSWETIRAIERPLAALGITAFYYCAHDLDAGCSCRKPQPGLLFKAAADHSLDLSRSWMIGDEETDIAAGQAAGCRTLRIARRGVRTSADAVAPDVLAASRHVSGRDASD
jgi:D-glycero-D-manno-heptose 1,7-bisphosphate phosphatase